MGEFRFLLTQASSPRLSSIAAQWEAKERLMGRRAKPAKAKVEAKRPPARKSLNTDDSRLRDLEKRLTEALKREAEAREQQTATAEILQVISSSSRRSKPGGWNWS